MLFNIVNSLQQCWQQNIVPYSSHQLETSCSFFAVQLMFQVDTPRNAVPIKNLLYITIQTYTEPKYFYSVVKNGKKGTPAAVSLLNLGFSADCNALWSSQGNVILLNCRKHKIFGSER